MGTSSFGGALKIFLMLIKVIKLVLGFLIRIDFQATQINDLVTLLVNPRKLFKEKALLLNAKRGCCTCISTLETCSEGSLVMTRYNDKSTYSVVSASLSSKLFLVTRWIEALAFSMVASMTVKEESFGARFPPVVSGSLTFSFVSFAPETVDFRCTGVARISVGVTAGAPVGCDGNSAAVEEED